MQTWDWFDALLLLSGATIPVNYAAVIARSDSDEAIQQHPFKGAVDWIASLRSQ
jgi:hypothetical protein